MDGKSKGLDGGPRVHFFYKSDSKYVDLWQEFHVFLIILGGVLSIIELLTENSSSIFLSGIILLVILKIFKSKFF